MILSWSDVASSKASKVIQKCIYQMETNIRLFFSSTNLDSILIANKYLYQILKSRVLGQLYVQIGFRDSLWLCKLEFSSIYGAMWISQTRGNGLLKYINFLTFNFG